MRQAYSADEAVVHIVKTFTEAEAAFTSLSTGALRRSTPCCAMPRISCSMPCANSTKAPATWRIRKRYERSNDHPSLGRCAREAHAHGLFIDDSATMREVIKIAFRRESINIVACADAAAALAQFPQNPPDAVITDVIMPDQDGYSVCTQIKQHPEYGAIPVILMSGVVNKTVADKAIAVKADELIRKPFQPQELIGPRKEPARAKKSRHRPRRPNATSAPARCKAYLHPRLRLRKRFPRHQPVQSVPLAMKPSPVIAPTRKRLAPRPCRSLHAAADRTRSSSAARFSRANRESRHHKAQNRNRAPRAPREKNSKPNYKSSASTTKPSNNTCTT